MKRTLLATAVLAGAGALATAASAAPGLAPAGLAVDNELLQKTHDSHRACVWGPAAWHYHSRFRGRVACRPVSPGRVWTWRSEGPIVGWWHPHERRWHHHR